MGLRLIFTVCSFIAGKLQINSKNVKSIHKLVSCLVCTRGHSWSNKVFIFKEKTILLTYLN